MRTRAILFGTVLIGTDFNDTFIGNDDVNTFDGGAGNDNIETRDGAVDTVDCGAGNRHQQRRRRRPSHRMRAARAATEADANPDADAVLVRCVTKKGKRCKGRLGKRFTKHNTGGSFRVKSFDKKRYPAGSRLEFIVTNPAFFTQVKIIKINRNRDPSIATRCQDSPTSPRRAC